MAERIAKKLGAEIDTSASAHDLASVFHEGVLIASFGIRRGSAKNSGHDHIPKDLHVGPGFAKQLAQCQRSREEWLEKLRERGII